jgi:hypothetical protein
MKKITTFIFLILVYGFLTNTQGSIARGSQVDVAASGKTAGLNKDAIMAKAASLAVPFVRNAGRFNKEVRYSADLFAGRFFLTDKELVYSLVNGTQKMTIRPGEKRPEQKTGKRVPAKGITFREFFMDQGGAKIRFHPSGAEKGPTEVSYFRGNDPAKWQSGLSSYNGVLLGEVYPCIEVKLKASSGNVEKIFAVNPGGDAARIRIGVTGVGALKIAVDGRLLLKNGLGELAMRAPIAWQEIAGRQREVKVAYRLLEKHLYGFAVSSEYDKDYALFIDPALDTILASTLFGGSGFDFSTSLALDGKGNVYLTGGASSLDFPITSRAYDPTYNGGVVYSPDVFVSKFNGDMTKLLASTYLGGRDTDEGNSLALDDSGNVYLTGTTGSDNFPTTPGAYNQTYNGGSEYEPLDVFVSKLNCNLSQLLASTYLGGRDKDEGNSLALDDAGNVILTGGTASDDFPTTNGAFDRIFNGGGYSYSRYDAFISKLNRNLTQLLASTYLGGSGYETGNSLVVDKTSNIYLTGLTYSKDFPTTPGAYDRTHNDDCDSDVFVSKLNSNLTQLLASTYLGGSGYETGNSLVLGSSGDVYLAGSTCSGDFPTTRGAYERKFYGDEGDAFISKLKCDLTELLASTFLSSPGQDAKSVNAIALDGFNNVYVTGIIQIYCGFDGLEDDYNGLVFFSKLDKNLTTLLGEKHIGDEFCQNYDNWCYGISLALDAAGSVYFTGRRGYKDFPTTEGAFDRTLGGIFISKLNGDSDISIFLASPNGGESWVAGTVHDITWATSGKTANVRIEVSTDNGSNPSDVSVSTTNNRSYPWTITPGSTGTIANVRIEVSTNNGSSWSDVIVSTANNHSYPWTVPDTPSSQCLVRISDAANAAISDTSDAVFSILMNIDLLAERREVRAFSIVRQYGWIQFLGGTSYIQVAQYRLMRRQGSGEFVLLKTITPSELQNNQFQMQDKYLEKDIPYIYRVEAYDAGGQLIGISMDKTI